MSCCCPDPGLVHDLLLSRSWKCLDSGVAQAFMLSMSWCRTDTAVVQVLLLSSFWCCSGPDVRGCHCPVFSRPWSCSRPPVVLVLLFFRSWCCSGFCMSMSWCSTGTCCPCPGVVQVRVVRVLVFFWSKRFPHFSVLHDPAVQLLAWSFYLVLSDF